MLQLIPRPTYHSPLSTSFQWRSALTDGADRRTLSSGPIIGRPFAGLKPARPAGRPLRPSAVMARSRRSLWAWCSAQPELTGRLASRNYFEISNRCRGSGGRARTPRVRCARRKLLSCSFQDSFAAYRDLLVVVRSRFSSICSHHTRKSSELGWFCDVHRQFIGTNDIIF